jgi:hypothetical protein
MNRHERRRQVKLHKQGLRGLRLRCAGCDRAGREMTHEHFFPKWLIEYADVTRRGIEWLGREAVSPDKATVPLCSECNNLFGTVLEGPVSRIFRALDNDQPISDLDAELLVRWMWKFEGLQFHVFAKPEDHYTQKYSLRDRVTKPHAFAEARADMMLAIATSHANDPGRGDWPLGLDTPVGENALTMSGVFRRVAIITSLERFDELITPVYGKYKFGQIPVNRTVPVFSPPRSFLFSKGATNLTQGVGALLSAAHDEWGRTIMERGIGPSAIIPIRNRVELPPT